MSRSSDLVRLASGASGGTTGHDHGADLGHHPRRASTAGTAPFPGRRATPSELPQERRPWLTFSPSAAFERCTTWNSENSARPHGPFSTPMPLHLKPPKGCWGARARCVFTQAVPHSSCAATSAARSVSAPHTEPESPKWVALARSMASPRSR